MGPIFQSSFMVFLAGLLILTGCASKFDLKHGLKFNLNRLKDYSEIPVVRHLPSNSFLINDSSLAGALFGAIGNAGGSVLTLASAKTDGEALSKKIGLEDPIVNVQKDFVSRLQEKLGSSRFRSVDKPPEGDSVEYFKKIYKSGMVLDFKTTGWGISSSASSGYKVYYNAQSRWINITDQKIDWTGDCRFEGKETTLELLQQDNGSLLMLTLNEGTEACSFQLFSALLEK